MSLSTKVGEVRVVQVTLKHFFMNMSKVYYDATTEQNETAQKFQHLQNILQVELVDLKVYRVGEVLIEALIIGKLPYEFLCWIKYKSD